VATKLICGLGNPGAEYAGNRHNLGFLVLDAVSRRVRTEVNQRKFDGRLGQGALGNHRLLLFKPEIFMNASGTAVAAAARFYKISPGDLLVIHDELDLPFGRLQLKFGGGAGGHRGLSSIIEQLGSDDFARLRVGIGKPEAAGAKEQVVGHVLSDFAPDEQEVLPQLIGRAADAVESWTVEGLAAAMNRFNRR